jgi:hypothetical protein
MLAGSNIGVRRIAAAAAASALFATLLSYVPANANPAPAKVASAPAGGTCGNVEIGSTGSKDVQAAETCFSSAYATCDAAMFAVAYHGGDAGVTRTFETMRSANTDGCTVAEVVDHYKGSTLAESDTYLCSAMKTGADGVTFQRCGADGDVFVPTDLSSAGAKKLMSSSIAFQLQA